MTHLLDRNSGPTTRTRYSVLLLFVLIVGIAAGLALAQVRTPAARVRQAGQSHAVIAAGSPTPSSASSAAFGGRIPGRAVPVDRTSRTPGGAVAAAARYATLLAQVWPLPAGSARTRLADAATTSYQARLVAAVSAQLVPLQDQVAAVGDGTTYRQSVLATHLDTYHDSHDSSTASASDAVARVSVWTLLVIAQVGPTADTTANASGGFVTTQIDLRYERGAWRMSGSTDHDGPTPLLEGTPATGNQMAKQLNGFRDWRP